MQTACFQMRWYVADESAAADALLCLVVVRRNFGSVNCKPLIHSIELTPFHQHRYFL